jgi:hypothetical protein
MRLDGRCQYIRGQGPEAQSSSGSLKVLGRALAVAVVLHDVEAELLTLDKRAHAGPLDGGDMDEDVRLAAALLDEAKALGRIEELHGSSVHDDFLSIAHRKLLAVRGARQTVQIDFERKIADSADRARNNISTSKIDTENISDHGV